MVYFCSIPQSFTPSTCLVNVSVGLPAKTQMSGAGLKYCVVASLTTTNQTNLTTNELVPQIRVPAPHVVNVSHGVKRFCAKKPKLFCRFFFDLDAENNNSSISEAASLIKGRRLGATASTSHMLDSSVHAWSPGLFHAGRHAGPAQRFRTARLQFRCGAHIQCDERHFPWPLWGYVPSISTTLCLTFASAALLVCYSAVP